MRLDNVPESDAIEDRRGDSGGYGGGGGMPMGGGGLGIGGMLVLGLIGYALGIDPRLLIGGAEVLTRNTPRQEAPVPPGRTGVPGDETGKWVARVLGTTEVTWKAIFAAEGKTYERPSLVMFSGVLRGTSCGDAQAAMGPFYCPGNKKIYIDTSFFRDIEVKFRGCTGKACEFSRAYVIAHEVGHHVQNITGVLAKAQQAQRASGDRAAANRIQVRVELQADCFAGVWAFHAEQKWKLMEPGDIEAAMQTASAIGDDMLQRKATGRVVPDSFTHGTSEQRKRWFMTGFKSGKLSDCNTFSVPSASL
jgi:predicted metalloprotease